MRWAGQKYRRIGRGGVPVFLILLNCGKRFGLAAWPVVSTFFSNDKVNRRHARLLIEYEKEMWEKQSTDKSYLRKQNLCSFLSARWQQQFATACFGWGSTPNLPFPWGFRDPHLTQCVMGPHKCTCQMASKSVEQFQQGARMWQTTDRQADHVTKKCLAIGVIGCATKAIPPKKQPYEPATLVHRRPSWAVSLRCCSALDLSIIYPPIQHQLYVQCIQTTLICHFHHQANRIQPNNSLGLYSRSYFLLILKFQVSVLKVKIVHAVRVSIRWPITELRSVTCHNESHIFTCHPTWLNVSHRHGSQTGQYSIYLARRDGRLSWPGSRGCRLSVVPFCSWASELWPR